ncbi:uncharacterized protein LOC127790602 [Diospyros lotus]|uniref:uncharacterized protein LOC127790602 n=1 Tax=Diospyros lotus TaxID=55363 RepID=UPI002253A5D4|nr:uncharacterized protein LOC127790602 [Diospyros lotus]
MANNPCCSIEMEPRTLNQGQLYHAREVAVDILQKKEPTDEPCGVFIQEATTIQKTEVFVKGDLVDDKLKHVECEEKTRIIGTSCQCICSSNGSIESPDQMNLKEPLSAPF